MGKNVLFVLFNYLEMYVYMRDVGHVLSVLSIFGRRPGSVRPCTVQAVCP